MEAGGILQSAIIVTKTCSNPTAQHRAWWGEVGQRERRVRDTVEGDELISQSI